MCISLYCIYTFLFKRSMTKIKILDASGPPGLPTLLGGASETTVNTAISVLSFSPDGEVLFCYFNIINFYFM